MIIGKHTTYDSQFLDTDIVATAASVEPTLTTTWDLIPEASPSNTVEIKWYDSISNTLEGAVRGATWDGSATSGLGIDDLLASTINVGDVLRIEDEIVVVSAVTSRATGAATISVHARGAGNTTGAVHANTTPIYIVGSGHVEGTVDGDSILEDNIERKNFFQLVEEPIQISKTSSQQRNDDVVISKLEEQRIKALIRALKKLNNSVIFGTASVGSKTTPRLSGGIRDFIANSASAINVNVGGAMTETALKSTLLEIAKRGGMPNLILCSPEVKSVINGFNSSITRTDRSERIAGTIVDYYEGEGVGTIAIIADPLLRSAFGEAFILNTNKLTKRWFADDVLRFEEEPANSRTIKETLQGQFSLSIKDVDTDHARMYGITV